MDTSISAVIPSFNRARFLPLAVSSVRTQSHRVDEIIVVDDGSTDDTEAVVRSLGNDIRYFRQRNAGPSAARNRGIKLARGHYIAFLDADDEWLPHSIERQLEVFRHAPGVGLVTADKAVVDESGRVTVESWFDEHGLLEFFRELAGKPVPHAVARLLETNFVNTSVIVLPKSVLLDVGGFDAEIRYGEDLELWARIAARYPVACVPEVLGLWRNHTGNVTKSVEPMLRDYVKVAEKLRGWGKEVLDAQGVSADRLVASAWASLGYWYFCEGRYHDARFAFMRSTQEKPSMRSFIYGVFCHLPPPVTQALRTVKQRLSGSRGLS